jgi:hypothetical protein
MRFTAFLDCVFPLYRAVLIPKNLGECDSGAWGHIHNTFFLRNLRFSPNKQECLYRSGFSSLE